MGAISESMDFTRSSRQAWRLLKRLDGGGRQHQGTSIDPDRIAKNIIQRGSHVTKYQFETNSRKKCQELFNSSPKNSDLSSPITVEEITVAIKTIKAGKAARIDGVYPEMITHLGPCARQWLAVAMSDAAVNGKYCYLWERAKVLAILKLNKKPDDPKNYRPISLLCCLYKLLERIILTRLTPILEEHLPHEQASFRPGRGTEEKVLALTILIESGFERKLKTGTVLVDLSAAYDTVCRDGLVNKIARIIKDQSILKILSVMTGTRKFLVCSGGSESKMFKIRNGVPQGSVLAPSLFNIYIGDLPETKSQKLGYADDWVLASQSSSFDTIERTLSDDMTQLKRYFNKWYLRMNSSKTTTTAFFLNNNTANLTMEVSADNVLLPPQVEPKYLGITLDRSLTYRTHIEDTSQKLKSSVHYQEADWYKLGCFTACSQNLFPLAML